jgi:ABC-type glycerol-3-phosphate transport system substrate-binding protein
MRLPLFAFLMLFSMLAGCRPAPGSPLAEGNAEPPVALTPIPSPPVAAPIEPEPTPTTTMLRIWGPIEFSPGGDERGGALFHQQIQAFEQSHPDIDVIYEPKTFEGPAALPNFLRAASPVAPEILPDIVLMPGELLEEVARTGLLFPLDTLVSDSLREDLFPFATRDTRVEGRWLAVPLVVHMEQGVALSGTLEEPVLMLERLLRQDAPVWLFAGQGRNEGEMNNALLVQLLAISESRPGPGNLPQQEEIAALLATLQAAQQRGSIPRQVLQLQDHSLLFDRLETGLASLIQTNSRHYLLQRDDYPTLTFAPLPTVTGRTDTVVEGYLFGVTTNDPRQQEAVRQFLDWSFESTRLGEWSQDAHWLPARRAALEVALDDVDYRTFASERLENGWLRPGGQPWIGFAQAMQEQFRAVMTEQKSPVDAANEIVQAYDP